MLCFLYLLLKKYATILPSAQGIYFKARDISAVKDTKWLISWACAVKGEFTDFRRARAGKLGELQLDC